MDCSIFSELVGGYLLTIDFRSKSGTSPDFGNWKAGNSKKKLIFLIEREREFTQKLIIRIHHDKFENQSKILPKIFIKILNILDITINQDLTSK